MSSASNPANEPSPADTVNTPAITPAPPVQSFPFQSLAPLTIKLDRSNYPYWRSQALPALRAHDLEGYALGTKHCPPQFVDNTIGGPIPDEPRQLNLGFAMWRRTDQSVLSWLLNSISESMFGHVVNCLSSHDLWVTLENSYTTSSKARTLQLRFQLQSLKKGSLSIHDYILKMKNIADGLSAAGQLLSDDDLILYILGGLGHEYEAVVVNLTSRHDQVTLQEVQYMLQSQEIRLEQLNSASNDSSMPAAHLATQMRRSLNLNSHTHNPNQHSSSRSFNPSVKRTH
ncbi:uncharacterized protein LOC133037187 [Cannabis sativa]|uniref:uncharacterized protein LOC133037187 n=1 Tax=Cannabis sativa TaxID=3483 RepID=UPI0029C9D138|nr:uncharacterized protein LOC133037187 [Cannabis sativa]